MKIDNSSLVPPAGPGQPRKGPARAENTTPPSEDRVELSSLSTTAPSDPARSTRIEQLRAQVELGTYHVPAEEIARGIVDDMLGEKA